MALVAFFGGEVFGGVFDPLCAVVVVVDRALGSAADALNLDANDVVEPLVCSPSAPTNPVAAAASTKGLRLTAIFGPRDA